MEAPATAGARRETAAGGTPTPAAAAAPPPPAGIIPPTADAPPTIIAVRESARCSGSLARSNQNTSKRPLSTDQITSVSFQVCPVSRSRDLRCLASARSLLPRAAARTELLRLRSASAPLQSRARHGQRKHATGTHAARAAVRARLSTAAFPPPSTLQCAERSAATAGQRSARGTKEGGSADTGARRTGKGTSECGQAVCTATARHSSALGPCLGCGAIGLCSRSDLASAHWNPVYSTKNSPNPAFHVQCVPASRDTMSLGSDLKGSCDVSNTCAKEQTSFMYFVVLCCFSLCYFA